MNVWLDVVIPLAGPILSGVVAALVAGRVQRRGERQRQILDRRLSSYHHYLQVANEFIWEVDAQLSGAVGPRELSNGELVADARDPRLRLELRDRERARVQAEARSLATPAVREAMDEFDRRCNLAWATEAYNEPERQRPTGRRFEGEGGSRKLKEYRQAIDKLGVVGVMNEGLQELEREIANEVAEAGR